MKTWLKPWDYTPPDPAKTTMADFILGSAVLRDLLNADSNFLSGDMGPQYASPDAYLANMVRFAKTLLENNFLVPYAPATWNPVMAGVSAAMACFNMLAQLPVNIGDPNTASVMQAWETGKGKPYGGHDSIPAPGANSGVSTPAEPSDGGPVTILGEPIK